MVGKGILKIQVLQHPSLEDGHMLTPVWNIMDVWSQLRQSVSSIRSSPYSSYMKTNLEVAKSLPLGENSKWRTNA